MEFTITIEECLRKNIIVQATDLDDALDQVINDYESGEIQLDQIDDYDGVNYYYQDRQVN